MDPQTEMTLRLTIAKTRGMAKPMSEKRGSARNSAELGFEEKLWQAADKLRGHVDPAVYKHVVLGLIFLKYVSDAFEERRQWLLSATADPTSEYYVADEKRRREIVDDPDEYLSENVPWVPDEARWSYLQANAKQPTIGKLIDDAMAMIEQKNESFRGVLPKDYARSDLDQRRLGELVDLISTIGLGDSKSRSRDILGRVYEYFLGRFASAEGKGGGEFYTPPSVVQLLVEMIEPFHGRVFDPCCGSGGMFVQSERFVEAHGGRRTDISIYGQESNPTTWRLCKMNLALRGIEADLGSEPADSFHRDLHPQLKADFILANPPFNVSDWGGERLRDDVRWQFGVPPEGNANFAWVQHFIYHLAPTGVAGFVLANGSMSSNTSGEGEIRKRIIDADLVDCMVALPDRLFYNTQIPACIWILARNKGNSKFRDRRRQTLFIDARKLGTMVTRVHRELTDEDIEKIAGTYHAWRGDPGAGEYKDIPGFCKAASLDDIRKHGYVLTPGRYVGVAPTEEDDEPFEEKMQRLVAQLRQQQAEAARLDAAIAANLKKLGYGR